MWPLLALDVTKTMDLNKTWYLIPLAVAISLVYSASRYERVGPIFRRAGWYLRTILGFLAAVLVLLALLSLNQ
jgi:hypothetical protein